jgi:dipeptidyl aminopeptidase/acylaminoacyl peptidase
MRWCVGIVVAVSVTALTLLWVSPVGATVPGENGLIAFASDRDGDLEIYVVKPDGTGLTRLTHSSGSDTSPAWSPDGQQIAFVRNTGTGRSIVVMNADGSDQRVIAAAPSGGSHPAWSPDGSTIAFESVRHGGVADIYLMSADGSNPRRLAATSTTDWGPEWSPDGLRVAFARGTAEGNVYIIGIDGSNEVRLTPDHPRGVQPSWAPHGRTIAASYRHVWLHDAEDSVAPIPLAEDPGSDFGENPAWSPDASLIAVQDPDEGLELWRSDGSESFPLTTPKASVALTGDIEPAWQPVNPYPMGLVDTIGGVWHLRDATGEVVSFFYGNPGDYPFMGDWDCDGIDTPGLYRQTDGYAYLRNSNTQGVADLAFFFGNPGDVPIVGDFDGDGCDTVSIYRPSQSQVFIVNMLGSADTGLGAADYDYYFGDPGDTPFVGDFDGDGTDTIGLYRQTTGFVYYRNTHTQGTADNQFYFGDPQDRFVTADWNDNGIDSPAIYRPGNTTHYFRFNNTEGNADARYIWGEPDWLPVTGSYTHN